MIPSCHEWEAFRARIVAAPMLVPWRGRILPGNHFGLRDADTHAAREAEAMEGEMPDVLKEFSF